MKTVIITLIAVLLVGHAISSHLLYRSKTEQELKESAERVLDASSAYQKVEVSVRGFDVTLSGMVDSALLSRTAENLVRKSLQAGRTRVKNAIAINAPSATTTSSVAAAVTPTVAQSIPLNPPALSLVRTPAGVQLTGKAPSGAYRDAIVKAVDDTETVAVKNDIAVGPNLSEPAWLKSFGTWWPELRRRAPNASFDLANGSFTLRGEVPSEGEKQAVGAAVSKALGAGVVLKNNLAVVQLNPPTLEIKRDATGLALVGTLPNDQAIQRVRAAIKATEGNTAVQSAQLVTGNQIAEPAWLRNFDWWSQLRNRIPNVAMAIRPTDVTVTGQALDQGAHNQALTLLKETFGSGYAMNTMNVKLPELWAALDLRRTPHGIEVHGKVPNQARKDEVLAAVDAAKGNATVQDKLLVDSSVNDPQWLKNFRLWWPELLKIAPDAQFASADGNLRLSGRTPDGAGRDNVTKLLSAYFPAGKLNLSGLVIPPMREPSLVMTREGESVTLTGEVPAIYQAGFLETRLNAKGIKLVNNQVKTSKEVFERNWLNNFADWFGKIHQAAPNGSFSMVNNKLTITGDAASAPLKQNLVAALGRDLQGIDVDISGLKDPGMTTPPAPVVKKPAELALIREKDGIQLTGRVPSQQVSDQIFKALKEGGDAKVANQLVIAEDTETPAWLEKFGIWWLKLRGMAPDASFTAKGNAATIRGTIDPARKADYDLLLAGDFSGVMVNTAGIRVPSMPAPPAPMVKKPAELAVKRDQGGVILTGRVPSQQAADQIVKALKDGGDAKVNNQLTIAADTESPGWLEKFGIWWLKLRGMAPDATFAGTGNAATVGGTIDSARKKDFEALLAADFQGLAMNTAAMKVPTMTAPPVPPAPASTPPAAPKEPTLALKWEGKTAVLSGQVSAEDKARLKSELEKTGVTVRDETQVLANASRPDWILNFGKWWASLYKAVPNASFTMNEKGLAVSGVSNDQEGRDLVATALKGQFPASVKIDNQVKLPDLISPALAILRERKSITLNGQVPTAADKTFIETQIKEREPDVKIVNNLAVNPNVQKADWMTKFSVWWPALRSLIPDASLTFNDKGLEVSGQGKGDDSSAQAKALLSQHFGEAVSNRASMKVRPARTKEPWFVARTNGTALSVEGTVSTDRDRDSLLEELNKTGLKVDAGKLAVAPDVKPANWTGSTGSYVGGLVKSAKAASLEIRDGRAIVAGTTESDKQKADLKSGLSRVVGNGIQVEDRLEVVAPPKPTVKPAEVAMNTPKPAPPVPPAPKPTPNPEPPKPPVKVGIGPDPLPSGSIYFLKNSSYVLEREQGRIEDIVSKLKAYDGQNVTIHVIGHADAKGDQDYNLWLSQRRANRVVSELKRSGINGNFKMSIIAMGEKDAAPRTAAESTRSKDRRVDIQVSR